ncbi:hypothetical protein PAPYR_13057 [Paratrimastix pyriformis]|uniref:Uncharacterized protein n=1 Tax=Paratrimastix pyriformis TaxID=342808 RepID=A0ABQ8U2G1_9EUKA|nr:hypothetical protein PAPYR_13057 [Paratrimastix pyriformis]
MTLSGKLDNSNGGSQIDMDNYADMYPIYSFDFRKGPATGRYLDNPHELYDYEIDDIIHRGNVKNFIGVFSRNTLPKTIKFDESGVINMDDDKGGGTHWVCYYNKPDEDYVVYYDSYGIDPPLEILRYLKTCTVVQLITINMVNN